MNEAPNYALTIENTCKAAKTGRTKIYEAIASGQLPARKLGRKTLVLPDDLKAYLAGLPRIKHQSAV